ncbi:hypothetical protein OLZ32_08125 [Rhizobium sp. 1AS11]|uniref:AfsR/SARP family transcriptional regulator n=1 Tax=Rhizobium acaciae TaxID=2989736 RepID=UPI0022239333|nr:BTAD domain-containing putative transcriptional regulator [Rhizobium acaciae]MCW1408226.1 hypothetical protein [Rhizobium acaciae]MCW1740377.1 hypothetical protein [Rhizobium acaciae]
MMEVSLLGPFSISINGKRVYPDLGRSGLRMAAHLFVSPGKLHRREKIADLFWPEMPLERARAALNSAMWRLRKIMCQDPNSKGGGNLRSVGDNVIFDLEPWIQVDTSVVCGVAKGICGSVAPKTIPDLQRVIDLYQGPFMDGDDDAAFLEERERLHTCFVEIAHELLTLYIARRDYQNATTICRKVLYFDPYREFFVRKILGALCLNEQRAEAASFYERWQKSLRDDIGVAPLPETLDLLRMVRGCKSVEDVETIRAIVHSSRYDVSIQNAW